MSTEALTAAAFVLLFDQASKHLAVGQVRACTVSPWLPRIRVVRNPAIGLGLGRRRRALVACWAFATAIILLLANVPGPLQGPFAQAAIGTAIGGAAGNVLDVVRRGAVIDFIDLRIWPVFNVADVAIVAGVALTVWSVVGA